MRLAGIEDYSDSDLIVLRLRDGLGFGQAYDMVSETRSLANATGINPNFIVVPKGVSVERHRDTLANWAAREGLGIRCRMDSGVPEFTVGSNTRGILGVANNLTMALEQAYEEYQK